MFIICKDIHTKIHGLNIIQYLIRPNMTHYINKNAYARLQSLEAINHHWQESLKVRCYENARILPPRKSKLLSGGVCDSNGYFIEDTALHEEYYDGSYQYEETEVTVVNRDALFIGS